MTLHRLRNIGLLGLVALPLEASANAGTPLLWAAMFHLAIGNAIIGVFEGMLLAQFFGVSRGKAIGAMCGANYFSAWLGGLFIRGLILNRLSLDLTNGWKWFWIMVFVTFLLTLMLEWPFIAWGLRRHADWLKRSFGASLVIQGSSYVLLFGWYWMASGTSLYTRMKIVRPQDISLPESVIVYFISPNDGDVYRRNLVGGSAERVRVLGSVDDDDRLLAIHNAVDRTRSDMLARVESGDGRRPKMVAVATNLPVMVTYEIPDREGWYQGTGSNYGDVKGLGSATNSSWEFWAGFWPVEGLHGQVGTNSDTRVQLSYETPFGTWAVRNAVMLPTDKVLFQLGSNQICVFDPGTRRVALLWHGRGVLPVIALSR